MLKLLFIEFIDEQRAKLLSATHSRCLDVQHPLYFLSKPWMAGPNFPDDLSIQPSNPGTGGAWDQDSAADIESFGIAGRIWEAAQALRQYLESTLGSSASPLEFDPEPNLDPVRDGPPVAIELGAGVGYVGIHLALALHFTLEARHQVERQPTILLTDLDHVCPLLQRNLANAFPQGTDKVDARIMPLAWGSQEDAQAVLAACLTPPTHILCSDLVYFPSLLPPLLRSLLHLTSDPTHSPKVIIAYRVRSLAKEQPFWLALGAWFDFEPVQARRKAPRSTTYDSDPDSQTACDLQKKKKKAKEQAWHRFGGWASDLLPQAEDEPPEDDYFVFVATRRSDSYDYIAPQDDASLMGGWRMSKTPNEQASAPAAGDTFELLLLGDLGNLAND